VSLLIKIIEVENLFDQLHLLEFWRNKLNSGLPDYLKVNNRELVSVIKYVQSSGYEVIKKKISLRDENHFICNNFVGFKRG